MQRLATQASVIRELIIRKLRPLLVIVWLAAAFLVAYLAIEPYFSDITVDQLKSSEYYQHFLESKRQEVESAYNAAVKSYTPDQLSDYIDKFSADARGSYPVTIFAHRPFNIQLGLTKNGQLAGGLLYIDSVRTNDVLLIFTVTALLAILALILSLTSKEASEIEIEDTDDILEQQARIAEKEVRFVRGMALSQLLVGILIAFMGISVFAIFFANWSDQRSSYDGRMERVLAIETLAKSALAASIYGPTAARSLSQLARDPSVVFALSHEPLLLKGGNENGRGDLRLRLDADQPPPADASSGQKAIEAILRTHEALVKFEPTLTAVPSFWQRVNWSGVLRSISILFFIEAVAWFLLQQYRRSMEDYKEFHRRAGTYALDIAAARISLYPIQKVHRAPSRARPRVTDFGDYIA
jgi:hypothetical protein